ncbi:hypothetical protein [Nonomuraea candida]|uniref:hypothetical protein n=1 Tax=Nonomuraea candida TaxID=359159 RepID=UPI000B1213FF|nr:hypothetical protein [Nonomuraea candida]
MALVYDPARGPYGYRIDRGLEFAATAVRDVFAALCVTSHRLPSYQPHRKGKIERLHRTIDQTLLCTLPGYTEGPRDAAGKLYGPLDDRAAARAAAAEPRAGAGDQQRVSAGRCARYLSFVNRLSPFGHTWSGGRQGRTGRRSAPDH